MLAPYILPALGLAAATSAEPLKRALPPAFFLAGDSTTAPDGGWGDAFLASLAEGATGTNFAASGATTSSFRADGHWDQLLAAVSENKEEYSPYVTIQFGHNDQKTEEGLAVMRDNLVKFDEEVRAAGGTSVFFTSLSRRNFNDVGDVVTDLSDVRNITIQAAAEAQALYADLNDHSRQWLNDIGEENAMTYNLEPDDHTHLNEAGGIVFAGLVGVLLKDLESAFEPFITIDPKLVKAFEEGTYYYPE
ncbi:rhamnogalacturonan acetylesterase [Aspergillus lucknowensis]|uniref:SGNH hydrolase-type esterase domain-containing protein n=1 Tax=Aspergillus lucknowensis TaxID=176173 RepID=A0ABR4LX94_9EURO